MGRTNPLNAKVKEVAGCSTTAHINERLLAEAKLLLTHTDWPIADIADRLGFEYTSYFTSFFKKHTATTPLAFRRAPLAVAMVLSCLPLTGRANSG
ncbi:helix-turn-helix domain-containing protein [Hymenobacter wooponensis]|uniref:AraC family transcriptional regulator n=1 Tax=Hymenobacter wooponensis TaxID=1525360 RepID=A0A4Z0MDR6_9BACT|nr:helix-turn-helix domain-containing protein [Hymenobacter wooponensis]TGD77609.1 AraC family transcriptional regulator [Hymenobacter wooponensis]